MINPSESAIYTGYHRGTAPKFGITFVLVCGDWRTSFADPVFGLGILINVLKQVRSSRDKRYGLRTNAPRSHMPAIIGPLWSAVQLLTLDARHGQLGGDLRFRTDYGKEHANEDVGESSNRRCRISHIAISLR
jgi:hypothetical protein